MGIKSQGGSVQWSYGDWAVIEAPPKKNTKVSCQMCYRFDMDDHSCERGMGPEDDIKYWEKCKHFVLDPDYRWYSVLEKIDKVKGRAFLNEMMKITESHIVDPNEYYRKHQALSNEHHSQEKKDCSSGYTLQKYDNVKLVQLEGPLYEYPNRQGKKESAL